MATVNIQTYDRLNKPSSMRVGADNAVLGASVQALVDAIDAIILGSNASGTVTVPTVVDAGSAGPAASIQADRGNKWLFRVQSAAGADIGRIYTHELGTADNSVLPSASSDFIDLTAGAGLALKTAWEAVYESPIGSAGVLLSVQQVNRGEN